jgi:hypothetical protein
MNGWYDVSSFRHQGKKGRCETMQNRASWLSSCVGHHACCIRTVRISYRSLESIVVACHYFLIIIVASWGWAGMKFNTGTQTSTRVDRVVAQCHRLLREHE